MPEPAEIVAADQPPLDLAAWRWVLHGLKLVRAGITFGLSVPALLVVCSCPLAIFLSNAPTLWRIPIMVLAVGLVAAPPLLIVVGMGICCAVPVESGGRHFARAAFALA